MKSALLLVATSLFFTAASFSQDYYIHCRKILNTQSGKETDNQTIMVSKNKTIKIQDGFTPKSTIEEFEIDLKNKYVLPGLIDLHIHIVGEHDAKSYLSKYLDNENTIISKGLS
jgi:imidazolonepropionase-like amidohydrolase